MTRPMTETRLRELISAYGADPGAFPESEREAAMALLRALPDPGTGIGAARDLDALLAGLGEVTPSAALTAALIASAPQAAKTAARWRLLPDWPAWAPASAAASLACGLVMGLAAAPATAASADDVNAGFDLAFGGVVMDIPAEQAP